MKGNAQQAILLQLRRRVLYIVLGVVVLLSVLSVRLVQVQFGDHLEYLSRAAANHTYKKMIYARRGDIVDGNGYLFATSVPYKSIDADLIRMREILAERQKVIKRGKKLSAVSSIQQISEQLAPLLEMNTHEISVRLSEPRAYITLKRWVDSALWEKISALKLPGIEAADEFMRRYPEGRNACHLIGYVDGRQVGMDGVEKAMDHYLRGIDGWIISEKDAKRREIRAYRSQDSPVRNGYTVALTVDQTVQHIVEEELDKAFEKYNPTGAYCIVMRPKTGEILALANRPTYNPNDRQSLDWSTMRNRCIADTFEPGSTFKIVTIAAALNENRVNLETPIDCENGVFYHAGYPLHDHDPYGVLTVEQVLQKSSNIGFAKVALMMGQEVLYRYIKNFKFGEPVLGNMLPGERSGTLRSPARWSKLSITRVPMGHEVAATPLQMISAMCAIANGGTWMRPLIVSEVRDENGAAVARYNSRPTQRVIQEDISHKVIKALTSVVSAEGTARLAKVPGFTVAGKTGTANKWDSEKQVYSKSRYLASFIGFLPAENPEFVALVVVDEPTGGAYYGGQVAAPVFSAMASRIARHLDLIPTIVEPMEVASK